MTNSNSKSAFGRNAKAERKAVTPSTRRRSGGMFVRIFSFMLTLALIGAVAAVGLVLHGDRQFDEAGPLQEATTFEVPRGATFTSIIPGLEQKNIIPKQGILRVFLRGVQANGKASSLKAGEFAFDPGMSMRQVMTELTEGQAIEYRITFPEGWTSLRMLERIAADETLIGDVPPVPAEGSLLPNTYSFGRNTTRQEAVERLIEARNKTVAEVWATRQPDLPLKSPEELVILASIIEKETGIGGERAHVASVFINRLRKGMRLQTDPTVIYGIWGGRGKPKDRGGLRRSELDRETPYNTYKINGLPPTPIANPGLAALQAAANPLQTDDLYFVADGTGGHAFAKTLQEHNRNVANWRKIEAQRKRDAQNKPKLPITSQTPAAPFDGGSEGKTGLRLTPAPDTQSADN
ncbi:MAG: endolytic transglycosylase MltG [Pseudomonadota bacterium]